jgi:uncharacterized protein (DUF1015 family)
MAEVFPFRAWRYDPDRAGPADSLLSPPYDVITPQQAKALRAASPHNIIHLELPEGSREPGAPDSCYERAAQTFRAWHQTGVLHCDQDLGFYPYAQDFTLPSGERQRRLGVLAALRLQPYEAGMVLPHERTFPTHKEDRYRLLAAAQAQFSPIMALYPGDAGVRAALDRASGIAPAMRGIDNEGVAHSLWVTTSGEFARWFKGLLAERHIFIADGHHRYETGLRYATECRASEREGHPEWFDCILVYLVAMDDPGLALMPTHRMVRGLPLESPDEIAAMLLRHGFVLREADCAAPVPVANGSIRLLLPGPRGVDLMPPRPNPLPGLLPGHAAPWYDLEAVLLHELILRRLLGTASAAELVYTRDAAEARRRVDGGEYQAAFLLPPPLVEQIREIALAGERMPEKTTYFWPKATAGLAIYGNGAF